jgi:hypothetical protein
VGKGMVLENTIAYYVMITMVAVKSFKGAGPGPNVIKLFTAVIYHHSMVILSICVI